MVTFRIGDASDRLSFAHAANRGYRFRLEDDGSCCVIKPIGSAYYIHGFECDCPDKMCRGGSYSGHCKHEIWVSQLSPCKTCGGVMALGAFQTCFGKILKRFECPTCGNTRDFDLVRRERRKILKQMVA